MKFLYVAPRFHPNQYPIMEGLIKKGHQVHFCVTYVGLTEKHDDVTVHVLKPNVWTKVIRFFLGFKGDNYVENRMAFYFSPKGKEVKRLLKDYEPDVVVLRDRNFCSLSVYRACKQLKIKKVLLYNQSPIFKALPTGYKKLIKDFWFSLFPKIRISVCRYEKYPFEKKGLIKDENARFCPHVPRINALQHRSYLEDGKVRIFDCGKYRPYKNHTLLIDAVKILVDKGYQNFYVTILGQADNQEEKQYYARLQEQVRRLGVEDFVHLLTSVPYDEIPAYYLRHDIFALASSVEQATVSILDSMSYGLATISTSYNGTADYIRQGETGYVFKTGDAQDLSEKIEIYLQNPELVEKHGKEAIREVQEDFSFESYYRKFMSVIEEI
ncbi:MAG: glycosyltransferase family 4 protein [Clostridia bacterium]|nr:glycosyltransferase family 4 protein [Clostridia bacterium]